MDPIAELKRRLASHDGLRISERAGWLEAASVRDGGFPVVLSVEPEGFSVHYGGWHEHFDAARDAISCFLYGLRGHCRLRVRSRGKTPYRWTLEHRRDGRWVPDSTTGQLLFPFWRRAREVFLSNHLEGDPE